MRIKRNDSKCQRDPKYQRDILSDWGHHIHTAALLCSSPFLWLERNSAALLLAAPQAVSSPCIQNCSALPCSPYNFDMQSSNLQHGGSLSWNSTLAQHHLQHENLQLVCIIFWLLHALNFLKKKKNSFTYWPLDSSKELRVFGMA